MRVSGQLKHYEVVGRKVPKDGVEDTPVYRMKIFAPNTVSAKSRFWYFLKALKKVKKMNGEVLNVSEIHEKWPLRVKNYGIALRYDSRGGTHNMYKEFRDLTLAAAVTSLYRDMAARHRVRARSIQIIHTAVVEPKKTRRHNVQQFHNSKIRFPLPHRVIKGKSKYLASRPHTVL